VTTAPTGGSFSDRLGSVLSSVRRRRCLTHFLVSLTLFRSYFLPTTTFNEPIITFVAST
jgi:hypothetical protein